jgi:tetratricopeptide (TPR) repeat protein/AraC-like DNA-binding protein
MVGTLLGIHPGLLKAQNSQSSREGLFSLNDSITGLLEVDYPELFGKPTKGYILDLLDQLKFDTDSPSDKDAALIRFFYRQFGAEIPQSGKINLLLQLAYIYNQQHKPQLVFLVLEETLKYSMESREMGLVNYYYGLAHQDLGNFYQALEYYIKAIPYLEQIEDAQIAPIYSDMGRLYNSTKDYESSLYYYQKAIDVAEMIADEKLLSKYYSNIGTSYESIDSTSLAIGYYQKGLELAEKMGEARRIAQNLMNLGNVYMKLKEHRLAQEYYEQSLEICKEQSIDYGVLLNYMNISENARRWGQHTLALKMQNNAMELVEKMQLPLERAAILTNRASLYFDMGQHREAYLALLEAENLEREIFAKEKQERIDELMVQYETTIKEKDLEKSLLLLQYTQQKERFFLLLALLALGIAFLIFLFYRFKMKQLKALYLQNLQTLKSYKKIKTALIKQDEKKMAPTDTAQNFEEMFDKINDILLGENAFKNPELNLSFVANELKSNVKYISQAVLQSSNKNFNSYLNSLRIMEAKKIIHDNRLNSRLDINTVMSSSGYKSRSTFYTAFQKETGMTPKQFHDFCMKETSS